ncbi:MAG: hypothetical protein ABI882_11615 [Acidobacteriota bacterium]
MATRSSPVKRVGDTSRPSEYDNTEAVTAYLNSLEHPLKPVIEAIRLTILDAYPAIT